MSDVTFRQGLTVEMIERYSLFFWRLLDEDGTPLMQRECKGLGHPIRGVPGPVIQFEGDWVQVERRPVRVGYQGAGVVIAEVPVSVDEQLVAAARDGAANLAAVRAHDRLVDGLTVGGLSRDA